MTLHLRSRLSTALHIDNKEWLTLLASIYRLYILHQEGAFFIIPYMQVSCRDSPRWNEAKRFQYVAPTFVKATQIYKLIFILKRIFNKMFVNFPKLTIVCVNRK